MGEVFDRYTDTAGNEHWCDTETGKHVISTKELEDIMFGTGNSTTKVDNGSTFPNYGWVCPVCGRGLSPYTSVFPCKGFDPGWKVTC